jgi:hypothetical protein
MSFFYDPNFSLVLLPENEECGPEKSLVWRRGRGRRVLLLLLLPWCSKYF